MILLDTNVLSEPLKPKHSARVEEWLDRQSVGTLHLPATSLAEILFGIERLPPGQRSATLREGLSDLLDRLIGSRILPFDRKAAVIHAQLVAAAERKGFTVAFGDAQIGAVARQHGLTVATRDVTPFMAMGVSVIDPWSQAIGRARDTDSGT